MSTTATGQKVIQRALGRGAPFFVCPTPGLHCAAQDAALRKLLKDGLITKTIAPTLTDAGIKAAQQQ